MIMSFLDNDLYKFTMQQMVVNQYPEVKVRYQFILRPTDVPVRFPKGFDIRLREILESMPSMTKEEEEYLGNIRFFKKTYLTYLRAFRFDANNVDIQLSNEGKLTITIEGFWPDNILWEVPVMAAISQLYFDMTGVRPDSGWKEKTDEKVKLMKTSGLRFADFGTRRRFSYDVHDYVVERLAEGQRFNFVGTSNVHLAMKHGLTALGTCAHEPFQVLAAIFGYRSANNMLLQSWAKEYEGDLGDALTDTFTTDVFLRHFNRFYANLFTGVRQDSGDPYEYVAKVTKHYSNLNINPLHKTIIFSDSLNFEKALAIRFFCEQKIQASFGIGTFISNDVGAIPLNMVIKVTHVWIDGRWYEVVKLSDTPGKVSGSEEAVKHAKYELGLT